MLDTMISLKSTFIHNQELPGGINKQNGDYYINAMNIAPINELEVVCPLYGGTELPFIIDAIAQSGYMGFSVNIRLIAYSYYDLKNANSGIGIQEYPTIDSKNTGSSQCSNKTLQLVDNILGGKWCLILDDNLYTGSTIQDFRTRFNKEYIHVFMSTVATKTKGSKALKYPDTKELLKKVIPTSGYSIPDKYGKNGIVYLIGKRLKSSQRDIHK